MAIARALINRPRVLLLDEPLGAVDLKLRKQMQLELKRLQKKLNITFIYVTHDQEEALTMSDRIAIMHDGIVIDEQLAWNLYGGNDIIGMNIYINNVKLFVSGVIKIPETDPEQRCIGETPKAYISYDAAEMLMGNSIPEFEMEPGQSAAKFDRVTCYECIVPDPVDNFAYNTIDSIIGEAYKGKVSVVNNTKRFSPEVRRKAFKKIDDYAIRTDKVVYPFWENASRIVEVQLSIM